MGTVVLDALENQDAITRTLKTILEEKQESYSYFKLKDMNVLPCRCCGSCGYKTPGKCIMEDDMPKILNAFAHSDILVMLTPIRFGGYSSQLKKALDKFAVVGTPFYMVKDGHLLHPMRYGSKLLLVIGLIEKNIQGQEEAFKTLVENNGLNFSSGAKPLIIKSTQDLSMLQQELLQVLSEVSIG